MAGILDLVRQPRVIELTAEVRVFSFPFRGILYADGNYTAYRKPLSGPPKRYTGVGMMTTQPSRVRA